MPGQALWNVQRTMTTAQDGSQIHFASLRWICTSPGAKEGIGRFGVSPCHKAASCGASIPPRENTPERPFEAREVACWLDGFGSSGFSCYCILLTSHLDKNRHLLHERRGAPTLRNVIGILLWKTLKRMGQLSRRLDQRKTWVGLAH